jgi:GH15 family glucan-1,4-alpha-glucosidase
MQAGSEKLDAGCLRVCRMNFVDPHGPELAGTIDAVREELDAGSSLLYRYSGQQSEEGAFLACSFWLAEALSRAGRVQEARQVMDDVVPLANDVGLFPEELDARTHDFLGNFPQGLTHLALVNAAAAIAEAESS